MSFPSLSYYVIVILGSRQSTYGCVPQNIYSRQFKIEQQHTCFYYCLRNGFFYAGFSKYNVSYKNSLQYLPQSIRIYIHRQMEQNRIANNIIILFIFHEVVTNVILYRRRNIHCVYIQYMGICIKISLCIQLICFCGHTPFFNKFVNGSCHGPCYSQIQHPRYSKECVSPLLVGKQLQQMDSHTRTCQNLMR